MKLKIIIAEDARDCLVVDAKTGEVVDGVCGFEIICKQGELTKARITLILYESAEVESRIKLKGE